MCVSGDVTDCFCVRAMVVKRVKQEIAIIPSSFRNRHRPVSDAKGSGLERGVWPGQEVTKRGEAFGQ